jgi:hypothetical protein
MKNKLPEGTLDRFWHDPSNWKGNSVYWCPKDPRIMVPARLKWRIWTFNYAHKAIWPSLIGIVVLLLIGHYFVPNPNKIPWWQNLIAPVIFLGSISYLLFRFSSKKRYEKG